MLINIAALCNDAYLNNGRTEVGDPTEVALIHFANKNFQDYNEIRAQFPREAKSHLILNGN